MAKVHKSEYLQVDIDSRAVASWHGEQSFKRLVEWTPAVCLAGDERNQPWAGVEVERVSAGDRKQLTTAAAERQSAQLDAVSCRVRVDLLLALADEVYAIIVYQKPVHLTQHNVNCHHSIVTII